MADPKIEAPAAPVATIGKNTEWITLEPPYDALRVQVWIDFPQRLLRDLGGGTGEAGAVAAAKRIVLAHEDWADEDGVLPQPSEDDFWQRVPLRVMAVLFVSLMRAVSRPPSLASSTLPTRGG